MTKFVVPLRPIVLALSIGLCDLFLGEALKLSLKYARVWRRRRQLFTDGVYEVFLPRTQHDYTSQVFHLSKTFFTSVLFLQLTLLSLCIWLELSISSARFPSSTMKNDMCFATRRETRLVTRNGPKSDELSDDRITTYISQSGCGSSDSVLFADAVAGQNATFRGYPPCQKNMTARKLSETWGLQGAAVAHVANSADGDPHIAYGLQNEQGDVIFEDYGTDEKQKKLATLSSWYIGFSSFNSSSWFYGFDSAPRRIISNVGLPIDFVREQAPTADEFGTESKDEITCSSNSLKCYHDYASKARNLKSIRQTYFEKEVAYIFRVHRFAENVPAYVCTIPANTTLTIHWVYMTQNLPGVERNRSGPTPVNISISSPEDAQCAWNVDPRMARLYMDAMEYITISEARSQLEEKSVQAIMRVSAVLMGMKTRMSKGSKCKIYKVTNGSTMGRTESIVSGIHVCFIVFLVVTAMVSVLRDRYRCPEMVGETDPLGQQGLLQQLHNTQERIRTQTSLDTMSVPIALANRPTEPSGTHRRNVSLGQWLWRRRRQRRRRGSKKWVILSRFLNVSQNRDRRGRNPNEDRDVEQMDDDAQSEEESTGERRSRYNVHNRNRTDLGTVHNNMVGIDGYVVSLRRSSNGYEVEVRTSIPAVQTAEHNLNNTN